jgi:hypothetical protein
MTAPATAPTTGWQGDYDASGYLDADPSTWPVPAGGTYYRAGQWWRVSVPGTVAGVPVNVDDRLYPDIRGRTYGGGDYGDPWLVYGGSEDDPTPRDGLAGFLPWALIDDPWNQSPPPGAGCPMFPDRPDLDGWRLVVEAFYSPDPFPRRYGGDLYGSGVYGDADGNVGVRYWVDVTRTVATAQVSFGNLGGEQWRVPTDSVLLTVVDEHADVWTVSPANANRLQPRVGDWVRVGVVDPSRQYERLSTCRIENIGDRHDQPGRTVEVEGYGLTTDLVSTLAPWSRPAESASTRLAAILTAVGWQWADPLPLPSDPQLLADDRDSVTGRELLDDLAASLGASFDVTGRGEPRIREWPLTAAAPGAFRAADCTPVSFGLGSFAFSTPSGDANTPGACVLIGSTLYVNIRNADGELRDEQLALIGPGDAIEVSGAGGFTFTVTARQFNSTHYEYAGSWIGVPPVGGDVTVTANYAALDASTATALTLVADYADMVNATTVTNTQDDSADAVDAFSIGRFGRRTNGGGLPLPKVAAQAADLPAIADRIVTALAGVLDRVAAVEVDTDVDVSWLARLPLIDRGSEVEAWRTVHDPATFHGYVAGVDHYLVPGRWRAIAYVAGTDDTKGI